MKLDPRIVAPLRREFSDWRLWWSRAIVIAASCIAGLTVVGFTGLGDRAFEQFTRLQGVYWWAPLLWTPLCTGLIVWVTRRYAAAAAGSGIPQVMATLDSSVDSRQTGLFVSVKLSISKILLTTWGLLGGLSLGREGPSVQVAAGIMHAARHWLPRRSAVTAHGLLVAGGAAGIAAAFNTPLAGVMFAIEELSRTPEQRSSGLIVTGIVLAGLVGVSVYGNATYFDLIRVPHIDASVLLPGLLVALASGVAGGLFSRLLIASLGGRSLDFASRWRRERPVAFAVGCGLIVAAIGVLTQGATFGSGYAHTKAMLDGASDESTVFALFKFVATWLTAWSGVPAGIFAPSLSIGAALGHDVAVWTHYPHAPALIALGMAGFLAAATQAPLTAFIIVMEMVDGHAMVLSLMACALIASGVSKLLSRPLYASLAQVQLERVAGRAGDAVESEGKGLH